LKKARNVDVCGDGRCDNPGHSAEYGTYTIMDESTKKVIEFSVVQVTETTSSNAIEYEVCAKEHQILLSRRKFPFNALPLIDIPQLQLR
jgi:hypothetical protein